MDNRKLGKLLSILRREGVTRYTDGAVTIELGAARADKQDKQRKSVTPENRDAPQQGDTESIDDPAAWLAERYRAAGVVTSEG
jgi:hypothetical protein